jgi:hypothetical protein
VPAVTFDSSIDVHAVPVTDPSSPQFEFHHPATFTSRGVAVPFTTPMLAGARVRAATHAGIELVVPNPSGGRGIYILNWAGVRALCNPTLHDTMLFRRLSCLGVIDPARVRDVALEVARQGHAGQDAASAAEAAITHDRAQRLRSHFLLLTALVEQMDPNGQAASPSERTADLDRRASAVLHRIAPSLGRPPTQLAGALAAISDVFAPAGTAGDRGARTPRFLIRLEETQNDLGQWLEAEPDNDFGGLGHAITAAMRRTRDTGQAVLTHTRSVLTDPAAILKRWIADQAGIAALAMRCDWLLDGWERVCLLWLSANPTASRRGVLLEMAPLIPVLPREVMSWTGTLIQPEAMEHGFRVTSREDGWRTGGSAYALIERNEKLLAMST